MTFFIQLSRIWMKIWLFLIGCSLKISGKNHFEKGKNYIVVFNHNALLDVPLSSPFVPGANKTIAKSSFSKIPLFGLIYRHAVVMVDRGDPEKRAQSLRNLKAALEKHISIFISIFSFSV